MTRIFTDERYINPDTAIILTLSDEKRVERIGYRGDLDNPDTFESRGDDFQARVNRAYVEVAEQYGVARIDASGTAEEVQVAIREMIDKKTQ